MCWSRAFGKTDAVRLLDIIFVARLYAFPRGSHILVLFELNTPVLIFGKFTKKEGIKLVLRAQDKRFLVHYTSTHMKRFYEFKVELCTHAKVTLIRSLVTTLETLSVLRLHSLNLQARVASNHVIEDFTASSLPLLGSVFAPIVGLVTFFKMADRFPSFRSSFAWICARFSSSLKLNIWLPC